MAKNASNIWALLSDDYGSKILFRLSQSRPTFNAGKWFVPYLISVERRKCGPRPRNYPSGTKIRVKRVTVRPRYGHHRVEHGRLSHVRLSEQRKMSPLSRKPRPRKPTPQLPTDPDPNPDPDPVITQTRRKLPE